MRKLNTVVGLLALALIFGCQSPETTEEQESTTEEVKKKRKIEELSREQILASEEFYFVPVSEEEQQIFEGLGQLLVEESTQRIGGKLMKVIEKQGVSGAFDYCHVNAQPMTDSISKGSRTILRRTSFQTRNKNNDPDPWETKILAEYESQKENGEELQPMLVKDNGGGIRYFSPIMVQPLCLNCHGTDEQIGEETLQKLAINYPEDEATQYAIGDLRGMWSINFAYMQ
jgi:hypothetical protein